MSYPGWQCRGHGKKVFEKKLSYYVVLYLSINSELFKKNDLRKEEINTIQFVIYRIICSAYLTVLLKKKLLTMVSSPPHPFT